MAVLSPLRGAAAVVVLLAAGALRPAVVSSLEPSPIGEAQAKAALLYNLPTFVEWPPAKLAAPVIVGISGANDVVDALQTLAPRARPPIAVRQLAAADDPAPCHVLFVSSERDAASAALLHRAAELPVLTVGDAPGFTRRGGVIRVYFEGPRLRLEVSQRNATRTGLRLSSKLLALAALLDDHDAR